MSGQPTLLASTWDDGLFVLHADGQSHELPDRVVQALTRGANGAVFASVDGNTLCRRDAGGSWQTLARCDAAISAVFAVNDSVYVGTDDARVLVLDDGQLRRIDGFDTIDGRGTWYAGTAVVDGRVVGPSLGVRSLHGDAAGLLLANIHVGGIPRSTNGGETWAPTIDVDWDAHQVCVAADNPDVVAVATAAGLAISHDRGETWSLHTEGLHAHYCSAVAIVEDSVFVAASDDHFSPKGAVYRTSTALDTPPLQKVSAGLPDWLDGIVDTACLAANGNEMAMITAGGSVYVSGDGGQRWRRREQVVPNPSSVVLSQRPR